MRSQLESLVTLTLVEADSIHDYLQLVFQGRTFLNIYSAYRIDGATLKAIEGQTVIRVVETDDEARLAFGSGVQLVIGLREKDYLGPEAMELVRDGEPTVVWQPA